MLEQSLFTRELPAGPLDIVGDVHGEIEPLRQLLRNLGYGDDGEHVRGRFLVFVGDLTDRGPDSPAVVHLVRTLMQRGLALAVAGNHELNLLRRDAKDGNGWAFEDNHDRKRDKYLHSRDAGHEERIEIYEFFRSLPLVLQRRDIRIVHACWHDDSLKALTGVRTSDLAAAFEHFEANVDQKIRSEGLASEAHREQVHRLDNPNSRPPLLRASAQADELRQMGNPIRVLTSGMERQAEQPFFSSGKWRMVERIPWWKEYRQQRPVIVGHYWRWPTEVERGVFDKDGPDLFAGVAPHEWLGPNRNVFCVDYSIGRRFRERELGYAVGSCATLAALRWPERELVFEDGHRLQTSE
jgi:hypothetical protein